MLKTLGSHFDYAKSLLCLLILSSHLGCSTSSKSVQTDKINRSVNTLHRAITHVFDKYIKTKSKNARTYHTKYHYPGEDLGAAAYKKKKRARISITILGDRRPYRISILYRVDKLSGGKYQLSHYDKKLAKHYLERVETYLVSRPEGRDIIDDFRVY